MAATKKLVSRLDIAGAVALHAELLPAIATQKQIALDCSAVETCGAAAAQVLVSLSKTLKQDGGRLTLSNLSDSMRADLAALGLEHHFDGGTP